MTWIASLSPTSCKQPQWQLLKCSECFHVNVSRRKEECSLCSSPHFFLVCKHFQWVNRMGKNVLPGSGKRNIPESSHSPEFDPPAPWSPKTNSLSWLRSWGHGGLVRSACPLLQCHTVIFPGRGGNTAFGEALTGQSSSCSPYRLSYLGLHPCKALPWPTKHKVPVFQVRSASSSPSACFYHLLSWFLGRLTFHPFFSEWNLYNKINHFKAYDLVAFSTLLCNHHPYLVLKHFCHPQRPHILKWALPSPLALAPGNNLVVFCFIVFTYSEISCKWNHTVCDLLCLASFT